MATLSVDNQSLTDKIAAIQTIDAALPYLKALPISAIKIFLTKSAKYGFFDKVSFDEINHASNPNSKNDDDTKDDTQNDDTDNDDIDTIQILKWCKLSGWIWQNIFWS